MEGSSTENLEMKLRLPGFHIKSSAAGNREKAEKSVIQSHLSQSSERQDLKKIYLYS